MNDKRIGPCVAGVLLVALLAGCISTKSSQIEKYDAMRCVSVAVMDVANRTKYGARNLSDSAAEMLTRELVASGGFVIVERERLDAILAEQELQVSDLADNTRAAAIGRILDCEYMLRGAITNFGVKTEGRSFIIANEKVQTVRVEVDIKVIRVETSEIVYSAYGKGTVEKSINDVLGVGGSGGYDEGLAGDELRAAVSGAVNDMIGYFNRTAL